MTREIASSPVLTGLGLQVRSQRGRFHLERPLGEGDAAGVEAWGRITPLADSPDLLLEQERRKGSWSEIARGSARKLIRTVAGDTKGTFHGLGKLDQALRKADKGLERLPVEREGKAKFVYAGSGEECSAQEALFHYFGLPLHVLVEPSEWYSYHRTPTIVEASEDRGRMLVRFGAMSISGSASVGRASMSAETGAGEPTGSGPVRAGTSPPPRRGWRSGSGGSGDHEQPHRACLERVT